MDHVNLGMVSTGTQDGRLHFDTCSYTASGPALRNTGIQPRIPHAFRPSRSDRAACMGRLNGTYGHCEQERRRKGQRRDAGWSAPPWHRITRSVRAAHAFNRRRRDRAACRGRLNGMYRHREQAHRGRGQRRDAGWAAPTLAQDHTQCLRRARVQPQQERPRSLHGPLERVDGAKTAAVHGAGRSRPVNP